MLRQPRLRFLLADDPGAGKTIMAGLLLKELKLRGALTRTLIVAPANLAPQWQREMADKFDEPFDLVDRAALTARGSRAWEIADQCVVSLDFAWRADVLESLARAQRWDLVIVGEVHKMAAYQRAAEERLVPAYIRAFFVQAFRALAPGRLERRDGGFWHIPYVPAALRDVPEALRRRYGLPAESYAAITFDKADLDARRAAVRGGRTFVGPGHPLFEAVVHHVLARFGPDLAQGAALRDPAGQAAGLLWLLVGSVEDGLGRIAGQRLFAIFQPLDGSPLTRVSPAWLLDLEPCSAVPNAGAWAGPQPSPPGSEANAPAGQQSGVLGGRADYCPPEAAQATYLQRLADVDTVLDWSLDHVLEPYLADLQATRQQEAGIIRDYLRRSFDVLVARSQGKLMEYEQRALQGADVSLIIQEERRHLDDLRRRQSTRLAETERAGVLALGAPEILGVAAIVPAPETGFLGKIRFLTPMRRSDAVEEAAMAHASSYEQARGWQVEDVSAEERGYDLLSRGPGGEVRYIEVKGRAGVGAVELSENEWLKAEQLGEAYWLYVVTGALQAPSLYLVQDPARRLPREEVIPQVRYRVAQQGWHRVAEPAIGYEVQP